MPVLEIADPDKTGSSKHIGTLSSVEYVVSCMSSKNSSLISSVHGA